MTYFPMRELICETVTYFTYINTCVRVMYVSSASICIILRREKEANMYIA